MESETPAPVGAEPIDVIQEGQPESQAAPQAFTPQYSPQELMILDAYRQDPSSFMQRFAPTPQVQAPQPQQPAFNADEVVTNLISNPAQGLEQFMAAAEARVMARLAPQLSAAGNVSVVDRTTSQLASSRYQGNAQQMAQLENARAELMGRAARDPQMLQNPQQAVQTIQSLLDSFAFQNGMSLRQGAQQTMPNQARPTGGPAPTGAAPRGRLSAAEASIARAMGMTEAEWIQYGGGRN